jgi:hypothetical protein
MTGDECDPGQGHGQAGRARRIIYAVCCRHRWSQLFALGYMARGG